MSQTEDLVNRHIAAFNAHDAEALLADFTPDAEWETGDYEVPAGELRTFFTTAMEALTPHLSIERLIDGGDTVAVEMTETWSHGGIGKSAHLIAVFDLDDGKIARAKIYREGSAEA